MKKFKIRASQIGKIIAKPTKNNSISVGAKTYCKEWLKERLYNRRKEFTSKYTDKGNIVEDESIDFIADNLGLFGIMKNEKFFENDFIAGTPDVITKDFIIDVKNSWDTSTFPLFNTDIPNKDYYYQLQGYMALTGVKKAKLIYVLSDTPINLIEKEAYYYCKNLGYDELEKNIYDKFIKKMTYSDIPNELKIKVFEFEFDEVFYLELQKTVKNCQIYINELMENLNGK